MLYQALYPPMDDEHELGYEEPSQAEKWENVIRKAGIVCIIIVAVIVLGWLVGKYYLHL